MIELSEDIVNAVLGYLGKRPYEETYRLIHEVQRQAQESKNARASDNPNNDS